MNSKKPQIRLSVRLGSLAMLAFAIAIAIAFSNGKDSKVVAKKTGLKNDDGISNGSIVFTNLQAIPSFGK